MRRGRGSLDPMSEGGVQATEIQVVVAHRDRATRRVGDVFLTLSHEQHLDDVVAGYGADVDRELVRALWSYRSLIAIRWLADNGHGSPETSPEVAVLRSLT